MAVPDAPQNGSDGGNGNGQGIFVSWNSRPHLPGELTNDITVDNVSFQVKNFQVLADAGAVSHPAYLLTWSALMQPEQEVFSPAPAGTYSRVTIELGGAKVNYTTQIQGTWHDNSGGGGGGGGGGNGAKRFLILDHKSQSISIACDEELDATIPKSFGVRLDLRNAISHVDFRKLSANGDGVLVLDETSDQIDDFREELGKAFDIEDD